MSMLDFSNQNIVVTGAASGIGRRTAELLIENGARVIAVDRNAPDYDVAHFIQVDLASQQSIARACGELSGTVIHGLANIAGVPGTAPDEVLWRVNYLGLKELTKGVLPLMPRGASIVNLASMAGYLWRDRAKMLWELAQIEDWSEAESWIRAHPAMCDQAYRRFKEALIVWTLGSANALERNHGVRMNCVSPGPVETPIFNDFKQSLGQENVADIIQRTGRAAKPDDIATAVLFLLSESSRWIVGVDLPTEGGLTSSRFASNI